jgi:hypothetical protein
MVLQAITEAEQHDASGVDATTQTGVPHG